MNFPTLILWGANTNLMQPKFIQVSFVIKFMCHILVFLKRNTTKVEDLAVSLNFCFL